MGLLSPTNGVGEDYRNGLVSPAVWLSIRHTLWFPHISRQTTQWIDFKFGEYIHYGHPPSLVNFWSCYAVFSPFPGIWLVEQFLSIYGQTADWTGLRCGGTTHYRPLQTWLTFGHVPLNSCYCLASDWSTSDWLSHFHAFADKQLIRLDSNLVGQLVMGLPQPDYLLVFLHWIPIILCPLIGQTVSMHLQT